MTMEIEKEKEKAPSVEPKWIRLDHACVRSPLENEERLPRGSWLIPSFACERFKGQ